MEYALAVAGSGDHGQRELGEIHLVKYVYLGDLAHAEAHAGQTFTEAPWRFYKFGPWCEEVYVRVRPVVSAIRATERRFTSPKFEGEGVRWQVQEDVDDLAKRLEGELPWEVARTIRLAVKKYGDDTSSLLHHVYTTGPMLDAAPNDALAFRAAEPRVPYPAQDEPPLTERQKKKQREAREELRKQLRSRLSARRPRLLAADPPPRYDELFEEGARALDHDAGPALQNEGGELVFSPAIWKSRGRHDPDLP